MKILIPVINFAKAGGYRVLSELANAWVDFGHRVDFLVDHRSPPPYFPTRAGQLRFDRHGITDGHAGAATFAESGNGPSIYLGMWRGLRQIAQNYDIVLANHSLTAIPVALTHGGAARKFYYVQAYEPEYYALESGAKSRFLGWLSSLSYRLPLKQIANAPIYVGHPQIRAQQWVPPGIDARIFHRRHGEPHPDPTQPWVIGVIGRREPTKGTVFALRAFEELARRDPVIRLKVAYGNLPEGWQHERAEVVVPRNDQELADFYRSIDIMVAPGTVQLGACHYPVIEAMACRTPVVTTGYLPADATNAWLVPVADSSAIARAVEAIINAPHEERALRLDRAAQATTRFHWDRVGAEMLAIFGSEPSAR